eukprot:TRINITY_DN79216_c0_g1_i1.p1 TRINITY_DN79216_c0_g1~~TRINITY_DN79216_c0_g1_i1.p1  ORF type:complete len:452 (-),score=95.56 TRINITY_DN79216_c0_g1_i1:61-1389(-)
MADEVWEVIGGGDKGGILVRKGKDTKSAEESERLSTGALVRQVALEDGRLHYKLLLGTGPGSGWVSVSLKGKDLLVLTDKRPASAASSSAVTPASAAAVVQPGDSAKPIESAPAQGSASRESSPASSVLPPELPKIPRGVALPTIWDLPDKRRAMFEDPYREPFVRLFCFYGVADNFFEWAPFMQSAPEWAEVAVYECKAHGLREKEPWDASMEDRLEDAWAALRPALAQHREGADCEGGLFAFMAHSSGAQLVCLLAERIRRELSLEPCAFFIADRAPPDARAISDVGYEMLCKDPLKFFDHFSPGVLNYHGKNNKVSDLMWERWKNGMHLTQEHNPKTCYHVFKCPIYCIVATEIFQRDESFREDKLDEAGKSSFLKRVLVTQSKKDSAADWDLEQYDQWKQWTTGPCEVIHVACGHSESRFHERTKETVWGALKQIARQ